MTNLQAFQHKILPLRQQATLRNQWLQTRLDIILTDIMAAEGFDMWLIVCREYNEDPVIMSLLPEPAMTARRRTILLFHRQADGTVARLALDRYGYGDYYTSAWNPDEESQFECLQRLVAERDPGNIGINTSDTFAFGDGLSTTEHGLLLAALGDYAERTQSAERLCVRWLESRTAEEMTAYPGIVQLGHAIIATAFSSHVIHPGITTTDDVVWWMRQTMQDMGLRAWFQPSVEIQADGQGFNPPASGKIKLCKRIEPGDLLHCDMGFIYLGLATDQQQHAYILKAGETDAPAGLKAALAAGNQLQTFHMRQMAVGKSGNDVLHATRANALAADITPSVYSHPLGYHGHAAGPTIGLWDQQDGVPGQGEYKIFDNTAYSIELNIVQAVPEWGDQLVRIALEEDAILQDGEMHWLNGRQTNFHLV